MAEELILPPLVVLVHHPEVIDSRAPECLTFQHMRLAGKNFLMMMDVHIVQDFWPVYYIVVRERTSA